ncbi:glycosyltransferase family 4 protein [Aerosakkonema sp. BLCC-F183]|uniref:glycosyltransferase family 4 protein n=1 Tax=Aerosakkonema sp. BLCC-F183 TaxID=3342834 RepID=UPI0035B91440
MQNIVSPVESRVANYRIGLVIEWYMGHVTHAQNLERSLRHNPSIEPTWMPVPFQSDDIWQKLPGHTLRLSLRARDLVRAAVQKNALDCLFYHTPVTALLSLGMMRRIPTILSLDCTPIDLVRMGAAYKYDAPNKLFDRLKFEWFRRMYENAATIVAMSDWAKNSLVRDYNIASEKVTTILPGLDLNQWRPTVKQVGKNQPLKLLFVGGDFERKGGYVLLEAFRSGLRDRCTLDIVTKDEIVTSAESVRLHRGLTPNSPLLRQLFADADLFIFPTLGDFIPFVVMEAMASGLPVVATNVGAIPEQVEDGVTGLLVPPNNPSAIAQAVSSLANNPDRLVAMGIASRDRAERLFNGERNYKAVVDLIEQCADEKRSL